MIFQQEFYHSFMKKIRFKLTFFLNEPILIKESKNQRFLYGWRYDGTLFFYFHIFFSYRISQSPPNQRPCSSALFYLLKMDENKYKKRQSLVDDNKGFFLLLRDYFIDTISVTIVLTGLFNFVPLVFKIIL